MVKALRLQGFFFLASLYDKEQMIKGGLIDVMNFKEWKNDVLVTNNDSPEPTEDSFKATGLIIQKNGFDNEKLLKVLYLVAKELDVNVYSVKCFPDSSKVYFWGEPGVFPEWISHVLSTLVVSAYDGEENRCSVMAFRNGKIVTDLQANGVDITGYDNGESDEPGYRAIEIYIKLSGSTNKKGLVLGGGMVPDKYWKPYLPYTAGWYASGIEWDIDSEDYYTVLDEMDNKAAAAAIKMKESVYLSASSELRHDFADQYFRHCPGALYDLLDLPNAEKVPVSVAEEDVADYLSDKYGYCIKNIESIVFHRPLLMPKSKLAQGGNKKHIDALEME